MLYFAYGSNMDAGQMGRLCPGARFVAAGRLAEHRLSFPRRWDGWGGGGVASLAPEAGGLVEGVLWELTEADRERLDAFELVPTAYIRQVVCVETADGRRLSAFAYVAHPTGSYRPTRAYMAQLIAGGAAHGLRPQYLAALAAIPTED
jgi:cation transport regulator ChaC